MFRFTYVFVSKSSQWLHDSLTLAGILRSPQKEMPCFQSQSTLSLVWCLVCSSELCCTSVTWLVLFIYEAQSRSVQVICSKSRMDLAVEWLMDPVTLMIPFTGQGCVPYLSAPCPQWHIKRHFVSLHQHTQPLSNGPHHTCHRVIKFVEDKILFYSSFLGFFVHFCAYLTNLPLCEWLSDP